MKKKTIESGTMLNLKGFLILIAFGIWVYTMMSIEESFGSIKNAIFSYGGNTLFIITILYILIILLQFFVGIDDTDKEEHPVFLLTFFSDECYLFI